MRRNIRKSPETEDLLPEIERLRRKCADLEESATQAKRMEVALRESLERFQAIVDNTPMVAIQGFDEHGVVRHWNPASEALYGYAAAEAIGKRLQDLLFSGSEVAEFEARLQTIWQSGKAAPPQEWPVLTRSGELRWVYSTMFPVFAGAKVAEVFCMDVDTTELRQARQTLRESEERLKATLDATADGILAVDRAGKVIFANKRFANMWRIPPDLMDTGDDAELLAFVRDQLIAPEAFLARVKELYESVRDDFDILRFRDGRVFERYSRALALGDELIGRVWSFHDVTERVGMEEERRKLEMQIQQAQKLESLGILAGGIAHDFNNLLMTILGHADLALLGLPAESPVRDDLEEIVAASHRAADLCRQMLAYSGKGQFVIESVDLGKLVQEMAHLLLVSVSKKAVLQFHFGSNLPRVEADPSQLRQVIMNLVTNASEAIGDKSGFISVHTGVMECDRTYLEDTHLGESLPEGRYVFLEVSDTGCGMSEEMRAKVFDPFFSTKFAGRGLGLAAVLGIVRGHKGAIRIHSECGKGSTFRVLLPVASEAVKSADEKAALPSRWRGSGTVLLVDDEESVRKLAAKMLKRLGFDVLTAADGREALEVFRGQAEEITCVILDLTMPHLNGEQTFRELRRIKGDVRVILSTGYNEQGVTERFLGGGPAGLIHKPYQLNTLEAELRRVLNV